MSDETELLTGRAGTEAAQGYTPMPEAPTETAADSSPLDSSDERLYRHFSRPAEDDFGTLTERSYVDSNDASRHRDENETVEIGRASDDLKAIREAEDLERVKARDAATAEEVDALRQAVAGQPQQQPQPAQEQQPDLELQPEQVQHEQAQAPWAEADRKVEEVLRDPLIRERFEQAINHERHQATAQVEQAKTAYTQAVQQNALVGLAVLNSAFPELQGLNPEQINGALRVMQPQRAEQYRAHVRQISSLVEGYQRQAGAAQQQQMEQQAHQYLQRAQELEQFKAAEDKKFDAATANENPETMKAIRENAFSMLETHYGIPQARMRALASGRERMDSTALIQSSEFQRILVDAFKFRMSQAAIAKAVTRPVPQVQRPGISEPARGDDHDVRAAWQRFNANNKGMDGIRAAADVVTARRRARG